MSEDCKMNAMIDLTTKQINTIVRLMNIIQEQGICHDDASFNQAYYLGRKHGFHDLKKALGIIIDKTEDEWEFED